MTMLLIALYFLGLLSGALAVTVTLSARRLAELDRIGKGRTRS